MQRRHPVPEVPPLPPLPLTLPQRPGVDAAGTTDLAFLELAMSAGTGWVVLRDVHLSPLGGLHGGAALSFVVAAIESATGLPARWATCQFVSSATAGDRIEIRADVVAAGRSSAQVQVRGRLGGQLVFHGIGATGAPRHGVPDRTLVAMPDVGPPDAYEETGMPLDERLVDRGHFTSAEYRRVPGHDGLRMWVRPRDHAGSGDLLLPLFTDYLPLAVMLDLGVPDGGGTSLDNTIRYGARTTSAGGWFLLDCRAEMTVDGYGNATGHVWTPDGALRAVVSQTSIQRMAV